MWKHLLCLSHSGCCALFLSVSVCCGCRTLLLCVFTQHAVSQHGPAPDLPASQAAVPNPSLQSPAADGTSSHSHPGTEGLHTRTRTHTREVPTLVPGWNEINKCNYLFRHFSLELKFNSADVHAFITQQRAVVTSHLHKCLWNKWVYRSESIVKWKSARLLPDLRPSISSSVF